MKLRHPDNQKSWCCTHFLTVTFIHTDWTHVKKIQLPSNFFKLVLNTSFTNQKANTSDQKKGFIYFYILTITWIHIKNSTVKLFFRNELYASFFFCFIVVLLRALLLHCYILFFLLATIDFLFLVFWPFFPLNWFYPLLMSYLLCSIVWDRCCSFHASPSPLQ